MTNKPGKEVSAAVRVLSCLFAGATRTIKSSCTRSVEHRGENGDNEGAEPYEDQIVGGARDGGEDRDGGGYPRQ